jgi:hypothetical protein
MGLFASGCQITTLATIEFIEGDIHGILEFASLILVEIYGSNAFVSCCVAFTQCPSPSLASGEFGDRNVSASANHAVPGLVLRCQSDTEVIERRCSTCGTHVSRPDACLTNCSHGVTKILIGE